MIPKATAGSTLGRPLLIGKPTACLIGAHDNKRPESNKYREKKTQPEPPFYPDGGEGRNDSVGGGGSWEEAVKITT